MNRALSPSIGRGEGNAWFHEDMIIPLRINEEL